MNNPAAVEIRRFNHTGLQQYLTERHLMAARCTQCGALYLPPRPLCPQCYQSAMEWVELSGAGRVEGFTILYLGLPGMAARGYNRQNPYCSGMVRLKEGPMVAAQIVPGEGEVLENIRVGDAVRVVFQADFVVPTFFFQK